MRKGKRKGEVGYFTAPFPPTPFPPKTILSICLRRLEELLTITMISVTFGLQTEPRLGVRERFSDMRKKLSTSSVSILVWFSRNYAVSRPLF